MLLPSQQPPFPDQCCKIAVATYASAVVVAAAAAAVAVRPNAAVITAASGLCSTPRWRQCSVKMKPILALTKVKEIDVYYK